VCGAAVTVALSEFLTRIHRHSGLHRCVFPQQKEKRKKKLARFMRNAYNLLQFLWFLLLFLYYVRRASSVERNVHGIFSSGFSVKRGRDF
jgi:hypothetical protein